MRIINAVRGARGRGLRVFVEHRGETHERLLKRDGRVYSKVALYDAGDDFMVVPHRRDVFPRPYLRGCVPRAYLKEVFWVEGSGPG